jgi:hypothetical protein
MASPVSAHERALQGRAEERCSIWNIDFKALNHGPMSQGVRAAILDPHPTAGAAPLSHSSPYRCNYLIAGPRSEAVIIREIQNRMRGRSVTE